MANTRSCLHFHGPTIALVLMVAHSSLVLAQADDQRVLTVMDITVHDSIAYEQYRTQVEPLIVKYGGK